MMVNSDVLWFERVLVIMSLLMIVAAVNVDSFEDKITCAIIGLYFLVGREAIAIFRPQSRS